MSTDRLLKLVAAAKRDLAKTGKASKVYSKSFLHVYFKVAVDQKSADSKDYDEFMEMAQR